MSLLGVDLLRQLEHGLDPCQPRLEIQDHVTTLHFQAIVAIHGASTFFRAALPDDGSGQPFRESVDPNPPEELRPLLRLTVSLVGLGTTGPLK